MNWPLAVMSTPFIRALEGFASCSGLLPEQIWDEPDRPDLHLLFGRQTGSATPLMWGHAEYIKLLLLSANDRSVFDLISAVVIGISIGETVSYWKSGNRTGTPEPCRLERRCAFRFHRHSACGGPPTSGNLPLIRSQPRQRSAFILWTSGLPRVNLIRFVLRFTGRTKIDGKDKTIRS